MTDNKILNMANDVGSNASSGTNIITDTAADTPSEAVRSMDPNEAGTPGNDTLNGDDNANRLEGGGGDDTFNGGDGADTLEGGDGSDTASYASSDAAVTVDLAAGTGSGGHAEGDTLIGIENLIGSGAGDMLLGDPNANRLEGGEGNDMLTGRPGNDTLIGGAGLDTFSGGVGDDILIGGDGNDSLRAGVGDDTLEGGDGEDTLEGGAGSDTASYASSDAAVTVDLAAGTGSGGHAEGDDLTSIENLIGSGANDTLSGDNNANRLEGGEGNDTLTGLLGNDTLIGGAGGDMFSGGVGDDMLIGGDGNDDLRAGAGDDTLYGGAGNDVLFGGSGADRFLFTNEAEGNDTITDLGTGTDTLVFDADEWNGDTDDEREASLFNSIGFDDGNIVIIRPHNRGSITLENFRDEIDLDDAVGNASISFIFNVNDQPTGSVMISGNVAEDAVLTADVSALRDADGLPADAAGYSYQWQRGDGQGGNFANIGGATARTYALGDDDAGQTVRVQVRYTDGQGTVETVTSAATAAVTNTNDAPAGDVTISGTVTEGQTLTVETGTLADNDGLGAFSYQWQRGDGQGGNFANIGGATARTYALGDDDAGQTVRVQVRYTDGQGTVETVTSAATAAVTNTNDAPAGDVTISGTVTEGQTLTAETGTLADNDGLGAFSYQWQRGDGQGGNFANIGGATARTYALGDDDAGQTVRVQVRYTDGQGTVETVTSDATAAVTNTNDLPTGSVAISGTVTEGQTLTAETGTLADNDGLGAFSYQWQRGDGQGGNFANIGGATARTYALGDDDAGQTVRVQVRYTDGQGTVETVTSDATAAVTNTNDLPTGSVAISGTVTEGQTLTAETGTLADNDGLGAFSYQWQRGDGQGGNFANIGGATARTYALGDDDAGQTVRVQVRYTDGQGTVETVTSDATAAVTNTNDAPAGDVTISGTVTEGQTLTAETGTLADNDGLGAFSYQWQRGDGQGGNFANIGGATARTYALGDDDAGQTVRVQVRYTDGQGTVETVTSAATAAVTNTNDAPAGDVTISGTVTEGQTLTVETGTLADNDGLGAFSYQWQRGDGQGGNFANIGGATARTYALGDDDAGQTVRVQVRYTDGQGTVETVTSDATAAVTNTNDAPAGDVTISGTVTEGQTLTAETGTLADNDGLGAFSYQWQRGDGQGGNFANIGGATARTYALGDDDAGQTVRVQVRYTDGQGTVETVTSAATAAVTNTNDAPAGDVTISGTVTEGQTLTAQTGTLDDNDGLGAFSYQWQRNTGANGDFENIANATARTYALGDDDTGQTVRVQVRYTDGQGTDETVTSDATAAVTNTNDDPTGAVTISGTVSEGETLTAQTGTLDDNDGLGAFSYQWQRNTGANGDFENIANATAQTYTLGDADAGQTVRVQVRYTDGQGTAETVISDASAAVTNTNDDPTGAVTISGTVSEGETLTAQTGTLDDNDGLGAFSYQWQRNTGANGDFENIANATARTYALGDDDTGQTVRVQVRYTDGQGTDETVTSDATAAVTNTNDAPAGDVTISGTVTEGQTLTAQTGTLDDNDGLGAFSYQWQRNTGANGDFENIANATARTYALGDDDTGQTVRVQVRYTDGQGTVETVTSDATAAVTNTNDAPAGDVTISGTVTEGQTLTAETGTLADNDGLGAFSYQWQRGDGQGGNFANIGGATARTYALGDDDAGQTVRVQVRYTDGQGTVETVTSAATAAVTNTNDAPAGDVTISGTVTEGQTLTAQTGTLDDNDGLGAFSYQWQRNTGANGDFENIANATARTYALGDDDTGQTVRVQVRYTDGQGTDETVTSDATAAVTNTNDDPTGAVTISGTVSEGETLTAQTGTLDDNDGLGAFSYQWQRNTGANGDFENIANATAQTYTLGDADAGQTVRVQVRYTDGQGTAETVISDASAAVTNTNDDPTGAVTISGTVTEGQTLTAQTGTLDDNDGLGAFSYQWQRNTGANGDFENIANATARTYALGDDDTGQTVRVQVRYTDGQGTDETVTSDATAAVTNTNDAPAGDVTISGTVTEGQTLTAQTGTLDDNDGLGAFSYQWQRNTGANGDFENIANATARTYALGDDDTGQTVRVQVRYTDGQGTDETVTSDATAAVTNTNDAPAGDVTISGTVTEGQTLTAQTGTLDDNDGLGAFSYQWQRNTGANGDFENIANATARTYALGDDDTGQTVRVQVRYTDGQGTDETVTSDATAAVTNTNDDPTGAVTISGTVSEGETLTAQTGTLDDNDGLGAFSYQWQRNTGANGDFENIANATARTYALGDDDTGQTVRVQVRYTDGQGTDETVTSDATAAVTNTNDDPTGAVTISGTVSEGETLTAQTGTLDDNDGLGAFSYQWQRNTGANGDFENIANATAQTYTLGDADAGQTVRVQVRYTDGQGTAETVISDASAAVTNTNDDPTGAVTISGTVSEGETLTAQTGTLDDNDGLGAFSYQWQRNTGANGDFENIANATAQTYTLGDADAGQTVRVQVRYTDGQGTDETVTSDATAAVTNTNDDPTGAVTISGTVTEGQTLTAQTGTLDDNDGLGAFSYQWQRNTGANGDFENIANATARTYALGDDDTGQTVRVQVRYTDGQGTDETVTSDATAAVTNTNDDPTGAVTISGTVSEGETLTAQTGTLDDNDGLGAFSYQWQRNTGANGDFENIANATARTYALGDDDTGQTVRVQVRYTDGQGTDETVTSDATAAVTNTNDAPAGDVTISGTVTEGQTLTAQTGTLDDNDGLGAFSYQWQRNTGANGDFENIANATARTYALGDDDTGQTVRVQVRYTDGQGTDETVTSDATAAVTNTNDDPTGAVTISGTVSEGETLTAQTGTLDDNDGLGAFSYQWQRNTGANGDFENIANATARTYALGDDDTGQTVRVQVRYTDGQGTDETVTSDATAAVTNTNDDPTGAVTISGTVSEGETLTAQTGTLDDNDGLGAFSYQWQRNTGANGDFENIANATARTYALGDDDTGQTVRVQVRYTDGQGTDETVTSDATAAVTNTNDDPTGAVTISGTVSEGETLTAQTGTLDDNDGLGAFSYQWQRNTGANGDFENIANATAQTYTLGDADAGQTVRVQVRYTDGQGTAETVISDASAAVTNTNDDPTGAVTISGTVSEGETLTAQTGTLDDNDGLGAFSYQWQRNTGANGDFENIANATARTYALGDDDTGQTVRVQVRYTDGQGTDETVTSDATAAVTNTNDAPAGDVTISGTVTEGQTLTAQTGTLDDNDGLGAFSYQWQRNTGANGDFENIANATARTYALGDDDTGQTVRVQVRYTDGQGTDETVTSDATAAVTNTNDAPAGDVTISGTVTEGQTLTAQTGTLDDNDGLGAFSYQWQRNTGANGDFENIANATARTYALGDDDTGQTVRVQVRYTDGQGTDETVTSDATAAVTNTNDAPAGDVAISGTVTEGQTLTADVSALRDVDGLPAGAAGYRYQWQRGDGSGGFDDIAGATGQTYTLGDADVGRTVQVQVSYTDGQGTDESVTSDVTAAVENANVEGAGGAQQGGGVEPGDGDVSRPDSGNQNIDGGAQQGGGVEPGDGDVSPPDSGNQNVDGGAQQGGGAEPGDAGGVDTTQPPVDPNTNTDGTGSGTVTPPTPPPVIPDTDAGTDGDEAGGTDSDSDPVDNTGTGGSGTDGIDSTDGTDTTIPPAPPVTGPSTGAGTVGSDVLTGSAGEDFLRGSAGNDQLTGGAGGDRLFGGAGRDNALYRDSGAGVMVDLESGTASGGDAAGDTLVAIEDLTGSAFDDTLSGDAEANGLSGGSGDDRLNGAGGADLLLGGLGNDVLDGGSGRDALSGDEGDDTLEGGAGVDELLGGPGNDVLRGGDDTDRLFGGAGNTMLSGDGGADVLYGGVGDDTLSGGEGADVLNGLSGSNVLTGGAGSDVFVFFGDRAETRVTDFNPSEDRLSVLAGDAEGLTTGNDESGHLVIEVGETRATLEGVSAIDEISIDYRLESPLQDAAEVNERVDEDGNLVLEVVDTSVVLEGLSSLAGITIGYQQGDADHEVLVGSAGHDVLYGGGGNDVLSGGLSRDLVIGGSGHDVLYGGAAGDLLLGESGDDLLFGEGGADVIRGGAGSDILVGGDGDNVLQGGAGEDMFVVDVGAVGNERIVDFNLLEDSLVFLGLEPADRGLEGTAVEGGTLLTLSDEHTLLVVGVNPEDLGRMDVVFF